MEKFNLLSDIQKYSNLSLTEPLGYLDFFRLFTQSLCVLTDSGGIQEEASIIRIPCITLRNNTERPETIEYGSNVLVGMDSNKLSSELIKIYSDPNYLKGKNSNNPFGDGKTSSRVVSIIKKLFKEKKLDFEESALWNKIPEKMLQKIDERNHNKTIQEYEAENKILVQLIFNIEGIPKFPYPDTILTRNNIILVNRYLK